MLRIFKKSLKTGVVTSQYPAVPEQAPLGFRGKPILDQQKCNACGACVQSCPSGALTLPQQTSALPPKLKLDQCVFCAACEACCSQGAIVLSQEFELAHKAGATQLAKREDSDRPKWLERLKSVLGKSVHIRHVDAGSCNGCDWEMSHLLNSIYDIQRLGFDFVASPRHADFLMVTGGVTRNLETALLRTHTATPEPRLVIAVGSCACSGGVFQNSYAVAGGVDKLVPVEVYIPGCPPRPQALIQGLMLALDKMEQKVEPAEVEE